MGYVEYESPGQKSRVPSAHRQGERRPGLFIAWEVLVGAGIVAAGAGVAVLVGLAPAAGMPVGAGVAVSGVLFTVWSWRRGRS